MGEMMEASAESGATPGTRGQIGRQTFDMARALIKDGKKPTEAFNIVAERTGRSAATVATAYYRVARTMPDGAGVKQRSRSGRASTSAKARNARTLETRAARGTRGASSQGATTSQLVRQLVDAAAALSSHVERLERENAEYRTITDALDRLKRN
jgi:hypothetical protein